MVCIRAGSGGQNFSSACLLCRDGPIDAAAREVTEDAFQVLPELVRRLNVAPAVTRAHLSQVFTGMVLTRKLTC